MVTWILEAVLQSLGCVQLLVDPMDCQASLSFSISQSLLKLMSIKSMMPSNHLILLLSPSPPALSLSQHQDLIQWVESSHQVAKLLELHLQHQPFQWVFWVDFLWDWSPCSPRDSRESSPAPDHSSVHFQTPDPHTTQAAPSLTSCMWGSDSRSILIGTAFLQPKKQLSGCLSGEWRILVPSSHKELSEGISVLSL